MGNEIESLINKFLIEKLSPFLIIIFGSYSKGSQHSQSDIDIAYLSDRSINEYDSFMLAQELADQLKCDVDLVDLNVVSTVFQTQIITTGKVIYCQDHSKRVNFEMKTLKMYAKLNEERKIVLDKIKESGAVYDL